MARRRSGSLRRTHGTREPLPLLSIFCEGQTEKHCIEGLRGRWRLRSVSVEVVGSVGDPRAVVRRAKMRKDNLGRSESLEIWVVFDRDEHTSWKGAIDQARTLGFRL